MAKALPHAVRDLEAVYVTLISLDNNLHIWRTRYTLFLWLGMLMLNPFDVDSIVDDSASFVAGVALCCSETLNDASPPQDAAAFCLAVTLTRRDVSVSYLESFIAQAMLLVSNLGEPGGEPAFGAAGMLTALAAVYKRGDRKRLRALAATTFEGIRPCFGGMNLAARALKRISVKLVARIGVALLKPRVASWCYMRGKRTLMTIEVSMCGRNVTSEESEEQAVEVDDEGANNVLEAIIDVLLQALRDSETKTRWSAAKGIGRIASRLPKGIADDIVEGVLSVFDDNGLLDDDNAWHGSCLALAELSRLGVLLPSRLSIAFSALTAALKYDRRHGNHSVGAHVRDAACYVAWAFARAYAPQIIAQHLPVLVEQILTTAIFDREVHVRRAAGAALQENIGRQGMTAYGTTGIKLMQVADFFALGNRERAFVQVASSVATLGFWEPLFEHMLEERFRHWDFQVRILAAKSLGTLVENLKIPELKLEAARRVVKRLAPLASESRELANRHGALLVLAEIVVFVREDGALVDELAEVVPKLEAARLYRGRGGDLVRSAACNLIECIALHRCPLSIRVQLRLLDALDEASGHAIEMVRIAAVKAMRALMLAYFGGSQQSVVVAAKPTNRLLARTLLKYVGLVQRPATADVSRGACRCLGTLPIRLMTADEAILDRALDSLILRAGREDVVVGDKDAETRRDALLALKDLVRTLSAPNLSHARVLRLHNCFVANACSDFGLDKRGDVGSWSRIKGLEAATELGCILSLLPNGTDVTDTLIPNLRQRRKFFMTFDILEYSVIATPYWKASSRAKWTALESEQLCCAILRHLGEKLDAVRNVAFRLLPIFLNFAPAVSKRKSVNDALILTRLDTTDLPVRLCTCLGLGDAYHRAILSGLLVAAGSGDSQAGERCKAALIKYATMASKGQDQSDTVLLAKSLILYAEALIGPVSQTLASFPLCNRLNADERSRNFIPLMKCVTALLDAGAFSPLLSDPQNPKPTRRLVDRISENRVIGRYGPDEDGAFAYCLVYALSRVAATPRCAKDVRKACATADALLAVLHATATTAPNAASIALSALIRCLCSPYPRVRAHVSEQLYARLVELAIVDGCFLDPETLLVAQDLLSSATWDTEECADALNKTVVTLAAVLGIRDESGEKHITNITSKQKDELESYAHLIKDAGY